MTKNYIKDNGRVRLCASNVAQMNLLEAMYYHRFKIIIDIKENVYLLRDAFILLILPLAYPFMAWQEVQKARKDMEKFNNVSTK